MHAELPVASFICAILVLIPLPWHWRAGTIATISIIGWLFVANIINGVNGVVWADNLQIVVPVWCDITTKIMIGSNVALPAAMFCLCVHLERVSSVRQVRTTRSDKRRRQLFDALICFGVPVIYMALHYIVQGHRFDIVEDFGCRPTTYVSVAAIFIIWIPPLVFSVGACVFAAIAFSHFWTRRITFSRHLADSNSALTASRYFRLMAMAFVEMFLGIAITALNMWFTMQGGLRPWISWENVHMGFSQIGLFPLMFIPPTDLTFTFVLWWMIPMSSIIFFAFFAFGQDAMREYHACYMWVRRNVFRLPGPPATIAGTNSLPSYRIRSHQHVALPATIDIAVSKTEELYRTPTQSRSSCEKTSATSSVFPPLPYRPDDPAPAYHGDSRDSLSVDEEFSSGSPTWEKREPRRSPSLKSFFEAT